jgi:hypothetical protein
MVNHLHWNTLIFMKYAKSLFFSFFCAAFLCRAADTNRVWFTGPHSGSVVFDTNSPIPSEEEITKDDLPALLLSEETNFLKSGFYIGGVPGLMFTNLFILIRNGGVVNSTVCLAMLNTSTNKVNYWTPWPKNVESQFEIELLDGQGKPVSKTLLGKKFGQSSPQIPKETPDYKAQRHGLSGEFLPPKGDTLYSMVEFDPKKDIPRCFEIKKPGNYKLILIHHIYVAERRTNGVFLKPITFSPVTVDVRVEK